MARIGFLGTGNMGRGMIARLLGVGHQVTVYNRTRDKAIPLAEEGARVADTPQHAAEGADVVFSMVGDDAASRTVWIGSEGALTAELAEGAFVVECSTLTHDWVLELAGLAGDKGLRFVDGPVTGLPEHALAGELTLLVGADPDDLEEMEEVFEPLCKDILHFGPVGAGTAYKLMINLMGSVQIAALAEGLAVAEKAGLDLDIVAEAIAMGQAASPQVVRNSLRMIAGDHQEDITFNGHWRLKDTLYGLNLAAKLGQEVPIGMAAGGHFQRLVDAGFGNQQDSKVIDVVRGRS